VVPDAQRKSDCGERMVVPCAAKAIPLFDQDVKERFGEFGEAELAPPRESGRRIIHAVFEILAII
jgi:hypothetical protein